MIHVSRSFFIIILGVILGLIVACLQLPATTNPSTTFTAVVYMSPTATLAPYQSINFGCYDRCYTPALNTPVLRYCTGINGKQECH